MKPRHHTRQIAVHVARERAAAPEPQIPSSSTRGSACRRSRASGSEPRERNRRVQHHARHTLRMLARVHSRHAPAIGDREQRQRRAAERLAQRVEVFDRFLARVEGARRTQRRAARAQVLRQAALQRSFACTGTAPPATGPSRAGRRPPVHIRAAPVRARAAQGTPQGSGAPAAPGPPASSTRHSHPRCTRRHALHRERDVAERPDRRDRMAPSAFRTGRPRGKTSCLEHAAERQRAGLRACACRRQGRERRAGEQEEPQKTCPRAHSAETPSAAASLDRARARRRAQTLAHHFFGVFDSLRAALSPPGPHTLSAGA